MSTYAYDVVVPRLARLSSREDAERLLAEYTAYMRGAKEAPGRADEPDFDPEQVAKANLGWLLGELSEEERSRALEHLPEDVAHPITGRRVDRPTDDELIEMGQRWALDGRHA